MCLNLIICELYAKPLTVFFLVVLMLSVIGKCNNNFNLLLNRLGCFLIIQFFVFFSPSLFYIFFVQFKQHAACQKCRIQRDWNSDRLSRRQSRWPLEQSVLEGLLNLRRWNIYFLKNCSRWGQWKLKHRCQWHLELEIWTTVVRRFQYSRHDRGFLGLR